MRIEKNELVKLYLIYCDCGLFNSFRQTMEGNLSVSITLKDFTSICRVCLSKENLNPFNNQILRDIFEKLTSIELDQEDKMPKNICSKCVIKLNDIIYFTNFVKANEQILQNISSQTEYLYSPAVTFSDNDSLLDDSIKEESWIEDIKVEPPSPEINNINNTEVKENANSTRKIKRKSTVCRTCNQKFSNMKELRRHHRQNKECLPRKRNTQCQVCNIKCKTFRELRDHQRQNEKCKSNKNKCLVCGKTFEAAYKFKEHLRAHTNDTPYECKICNKKFKFAQNLRRHDKVSHKGIKPYRCDICGKVFARLERKLRHDKLHTMICGICKEVFRASEFTKHAEAHKLEGQTLEEARYICRFCGKTFLDKSDYSKHLMEHRTNSVENAQEGEGKIKCPICNKLYVSKYGLRSHMIIHVGKKEFLCNICGKAFLKKSSLDLHSSIHTDEKPYGCEDCGKTFRQQSSYNTHRLVHTGKRSYVCDICSKAFKQSTHLSRHYLVHTGEKPYKCKFCDKSFSQNCNLKTHTRTHTGETPYHCHICDKGFHDSSSLKKHEKNHIKSE